VDITDNHAYRHNFIHSDVFKLPLEFLKKFDVIHASPPCQRYTWATRTDRTKKFPDLVDRTRHLLQKAGKPFIIENVIGAPVRNDLRLCGEMFGLRIIRHRIFEVDGFAVLQPPHIKHRRPIRKDKSYYASVAGHGGDSYSFRLEDWQNAMEINWVNDKLHLTQMIPPAYAEYVSRFL
jgi:DNA (cytosine-5)-methyltransferase 1